MSFEDLKQLGHQLSNVNCEMKKYKAIHEKCYEKGWLDDSIELVSVLRKKLLKAVDSALPTVEMPFKRSTKRRMSIDDLKELEDQHSNLVCEMKKYVATYEKCYEKGCIEKTHEQLLPQLRSELQNAVEEVVGVLERPLMRNRQLRAEVDSGCVNSDYAPDFSIKRDSNRGTSDYVDDLCVKRDSSRATNESGDHYDIQVGFKIHGSTSSVSLTARTDMNSSTQDSTDTDMLTQRTSLQQPLTIPIQETTQVRNPSEDDLEQTYLKHVQTQGTDC